jgi:hypothetical protein
VMRAVHGTPGRSKAAKRAHSGQRGAGKQGYEARCE